VAGRDKDAEFVQILLRDGHVSADVLAQRIRQLDASRYPVETIVAWAERRQRETQEPPTS